MSEATVRTFLPSPLALHFTAQRPMGLLRTSTCPAAPEIGSPSSSLARLLSLALLCFTAAPCFSSWFVPDAKAPSNIDQAVLGSSVASEPHDEREWRVPMFAPLYSEQAVSIGSGSRCSTLGFPRVHSRRDATLERPTPVCSDDEQIRFGLYFFHYRKKCID